MSAQDRQTLSLPSLRNLQAFVAVANAMSIHQAAEQLSVTPSAVSHQIASLESWMGKKLFIRSGKGVQLTPTGEKYLREVSAAMSAIGRATDQIVKEKDNAVLRVHSSPTFGLSWLLRRLGRFRAEYPDITIILTCSYENLQFARDNIDIDIRHGIPDWDAYRVMTIKNDTQVVLASAEYAEKHPISTPGDLLQQSLISSTSTLVNWEKWFAWHNIDRPWLNFSLSFDRSYMSFEAARMGLGFILESKMMATDHLNDGSLVQVLPDEMGIAINAHHLVMPHMNERAWKIQQFVEWMDRELRLLGYHL
ncbi:LysR family transcriptional regulator [Enterobacter cloacae]|jgi:DNA-binding transcriptional LysR family regulator|uniref:LysR substrate-binding domain-containing protein n=1 Tax=Enterobacter TaxID=547 RepID=UPI000793471E|nr:MULTISPECIES: LysR substrate-binding domain-containing protein [Enterobacter]MCK6896050.1 LysR substrate-binding domain-containing protein [Enterobacter bugandensis]MCM7392546.1 LysR substrate-binding domain-containing protein [Enterobacter bugandensis]NIH88713.1 DNA-binding transcriptional LysR family regulator [Enterobacter asburiae]SAD10770.1 LysR family transcriptional regulator [Enterobacter cloacae]